MTGQPTAVVTGAAGGIGFEVASRLQRRGYRVIAVDRDGARLTDAASRIGEGTVSVRCDLADRTQLAALGDDLTTTWRDSLDTVVCNAGVIAPGDVADLDPAMIDLQLDVILRSVMHLTRAVLPQFIERDRGHVLATVSMGGILALPTSATYSAAKAGLRAFFAAVNAELHHTNVHVSGIYPSAVDTAMLRHEANSGGSALNFIGAIQTVAAVADAYERAMAKHKLESYVPYRDSITCRILNAFPALVPRLLPAANRIGEHGRRKYLAGLVGAGTVTSDPVR